jgi:hypothetical protein
MKKTMEISLRNYAISDQTKNETTGNKSASVTGYARPKTRGELRDLLKDGIACEVVSSNVSITSVMLRGYLDFESFTVRQSENHGWSVFEA